MTTWYDPDEIKAEADGLQRQPEFDPEPIEDDEYEEGVEERAEKFDPLLARVNEVSALVRSWPKTEDTQ